MNVKRYTYNTFVCCLYRCYSMLMFSFWNGKCFICSLYTAVAVCMRLYVFYFVVYGRYVRFSHFSEFGALFFLPMQRENTFLLLNFSFWSRHLDLIKEFIAFSLSCLLLTIQKCPCVKCIWLHYVYWTISRCISRVLLLRMLLQSHNNKWSPFIIFQLLTMIK